MVRYLLFFLTITFSISASNDRPPPVASVESDPHTIVGGRISAITGDIVYSEVDLVVPSAEPLYLERNLTRPTHEKGPFGGWQFNYLAKIRQNDPKEKPEFVLEDRGVHYPFIDPKNKEKKRKDCTVSFNYEKGGRGITNVGRGRPSASNNIKNWKLEFHNKGDEVSQDVRATLHGASGEKRKFHSHIWKEDKTYAELSEINKPTGFKQTFRSYREGEKKISAFGPGKEKSKLLGQFKVTNVKSKDLKKDQMILHAEGAGQEVTYHFSEVYSNKENDKESWKRSYIKKVERSMAPTVTYEYYSATNKFKEHLKKICYPEGRYWEVDYIVPSEMNLGYTYSLNGHDHIIDPQVGHYLIGGVHKVYEPAGPKGERVCTSRLNYVHKDELVDDPFKKKSSHRTEVFNAQDDLSIYFYRDDCIPWQILHFEKDTQGKHVPSCYDEYYWVKEKGPHQGNMVANYIHDPDYSDCRMKVFEYGTRGNVLCETLFGDFSGENQVAPEMGSDLKPVLNGCESSRTTFGYTPDEFNLVQSRTEEGGLKYHYTYKPKTSLVESLLVYDHDKISRRTFFKYNENHFLVEKIEDDGTSEDSSVLTGVTLRFTTKYTPTHTGLPKEVAYCAFDMNEGAEKLLRREKYTYNNLGQIETTDVFDANDEWRYCHVTKHDPHGCLIEEITPTGEIILRQYDANDNLIYQQGPHLQQVIIFTYDAMNRLTSETHSNGSVDLTTMHEYNNGSQRVASIDPFDQRIEYRYDRYDRVIETIHPSVANGDNQLETPVSKQKWDIFSRKIETVDPKGAITRSKFNALDEPTLIHYSDGSYEKKVYNINGTLKEFTARNGMKIHYKHDTFKRLLEETAFAPDGTLLSREKCTYKGTKLASRTDAENNTTYYEYDYAGRESTIIQGASKVTFTYDALGNLYEKSFWENDTLLSTQVTLRDVAGRVVEEWTEEPHCKHFYYSYDAFGNCVQTIAGDRYTIKEYDGLNRIIREVDAEGNQVFFNYNSGFVNEHGQKVLQTERIEPNGSKVVTTYDTHHRDVRIEKRTPLNATVSLQEKRYDLTGNCVRLITHVYGRETPEIQEIQLEYDSEGRLTKKIEAVNTPLQRVTQLTYNVLGQKENVIKPDGTVLAYTYDGKGRVKTTTSSDNSIDYTYSYDKCDRVTKVVDGIHKNTTTREYTDHGELKKETLGTGKTTNYSYDGMDRLKTITLPDKSSVHYNHNSFAITEISRHNKQGERTYSHHYSAFDDLGNVKEEVLLGVAGTINRAYDKNSRITSIDHPHYQVQEITYNPLGNLTSYQLKDSFGSEKYNFSYDHLHQLTEEKDHSYTYDSAYNRTSKDTSGYTLNTLNQIMYEENKSYKYDLNGNLIEKKSPTDLYTYKYDALNRLIQVTHNNDTYKYTYDSFNRRLTKETPTHTESYLYFGDLDVGTYVDNKLTHFRLLGIGFGSELNATVAMEIESTPYAPLHDFNGNITHLINAEGTLAESHRYTAFGEITHETSSLSPWGFSSKRLDPETSFLFFGRRHYDPSTGRWTTTDPLATTPTCNLYAYVFNCPLTHFDLLGLYDAHLYDPGLRYPQTDYDLIWQDTSDIGYPAFDFSSSPSYLPSFSELTYKHTNPYYFDYNTGYGTPGVQYYSGNGVDCSFIDSYSNASHLSETVLGGASLSYLYNESVGLHADLNRAGVELFGGAITPSVRQQTSKFREILSTTNDYIFHFPHSEQCIQTNLALQQLSKEEQQRIYVIAVAPGGYVDKKYCADVVHLVHPDDVVPKIDVLGRMLAETQGTLRVLTDVPHQWFKDAHTFHNPVYIEPMQEETTRMLNKIR